MLSKSLTAAAGPGNSCPTRPGSLVDRLCFHLMEVLRRVPFRSDARETAVLQEHGGLEREASAQKHLLTLPPTHRPQRTGSER